VLTNPDAQKHLSDRLNSTNVISRLEALSEAFEVMNDNPLGIGSGVALSEASSAPLKSAHNSYVQNLLWFGLVGGTLMSLAMFAIPALVLNIPVRTWLGQEAKRALAISVIILLLINLSQASWEGSVLRVWIYFLIGLGLVMVHKADYWMLEGSRG